MWLTLLKYSFYYSGLQSNPSYFEICLYLVIWNWPCDLVTCWSVQFSRSVVSDSLWPHRLQHARLPCPSATPGVYPNSCLLSRWCHPTISSSVVSFSSCPQSFLASGSFPMSQLFTSGDQSVGASVFPMNIQGWFPLGVSGFISLQFKKLSRVLSRTTIQKHQFFSAQPSLWSNSGTGKDSWESLGQQGEQTIHS